MGVYYIRKTGDNSNDGLSPATAWATIGKALGASGISSGDTVYIGAGVYRETVNVTMTSATSETFIIGDVTGQYTGDAGDVRWTGFTTNDRSGGFSVLNITSKNFLTFENIFFSAGSAGATLVTSTNIKFRKCIIQNYLNGNCISLTTTANVAANLLVEDCVFFKAGTITGIQLTLTRPSGSDYDYNITIRNCFFTGSSGIGIVVSTTGGNAFNHGGVYVYNCTQIGPGTFFQTAANTSTTIPCVVYNCLLYTHNSTVISANALGQIIEDYNVFMANTARSNVAIGVNSSQVGVITPLIYLGFEQMWGIQVKPFGTPKKDAGWVGWGNHPTYNTTTSLMGVARPKGSIRSLATGTATAGAARTLTDTDKTFGNDTFKGHMIKIISGTGSGQVKHITSNTNTVITVDGNWITNPDNTSVYRVYSGPAATTGKATAGAATTMTDTNAGWGASQWVGYTLEITAGTGVGQTRSITANTSTALTVATWTTNPNNTSEYAIYKVTDVNTIGATAGCFELLNTAERETEIVRTGANAITIAGPGVHDFDLPVDDTSTTVTVWVRWGTEYAGVKPCMKVLNGEECGVSNATTIATGSPNTWEQLTLNFTPAVKGLVTIRLQSDSTTTTGRAFFDDFNVA